MNPADSKAGAPGGREQAEVTIMLRLIRFPTRRALAVLAVALLATAALPILAQDDDLAADGPDIPGMAARAGADDDTADFEPGFRARMARRLELTDAQQDAIAKIFEAGRARDLPLRKQVRLLQHDLQGEMMKDDPSEKTVLALSKQAGDLRSQLQAGRLLDRLAMRKLLTEDQRDKLMMMGGGRGGFGPDGPRGASMHGGRGPGRPGADGMDAERRGGRRQHRNRPDQKTD
jgi:Spy/CpxP family protein refolding chaperone